MENKIEFITQTEETSEDLFEQYYEQNIVPLVEEDNRLKRLFRSRFWGYLWSACFLLGANLLIVLFRYLMYHYPINFGQLFLITLVALAIVCWPIFCYYKAEKSDMFDAFLNFYGTWKHHRNKEIQPTISPIIPAHETAFSPHAVEGTFDGAEIEISDVIYKKTMKIKKWNFQVTVSQGVEIYSRFNKKINNKLLLFDENGFFHKSKFPDLLNVTNQILVPAANYFNIFTDDENFAKDMLPAIFFERVLDMKESFKASHIYIEIHDDHLRIYLEGSHLYFDNHNIWSHHIDKNKFVNLNQEMEQTLMTVQLVQVLKDAI